MGISLRTNCPSLGASRVMKKNAKKGQSALEKLVSGYFINRAADDASGLQITEAMRAQIIALQTIEADCEDGINLVKTADGYLSEMQEMVVRMVEITEKSANGILEDETDREALQLEMNQLGAEIDRIADTANFNQNKLFDGSTIIEEEKQKIKVPTPVAYSEFLPDRETIFNDKGADAILYICDAIGKYIQDHQNNQDSIKDKAIFYTDDLKTSVITDNNADPDVIKAQLGLDPTVTINKADLEKTYYRYDVSTVPPFIDGDDDAGSKTAELINNTINAYKTQNGKLSCLEGKSVYFAKDGTVAVIEDNFKSDADIKALLGGKDYYSAGIDLSTNLFVVPKDAEITVQKEKDRTIALQIGETAEKADKLVLGLYNMHTDKLFKPIQSFVKTGEKVSVITIPANPSTPSQPSVTKRWGVSGSLSSSQAVASITTSGGGSGGSGGSTTQTFTFPTYSTINHNAIRGNTETSAYKNAVTLDVSTQENAMKNIDYIKGVSDNISIIRSDYGAKQKHLERTVESAGNTAENIEAAKSRIKDTDMAKMMSEYTMENILVQSAQAMLAQANTQPQDILKLLQ